MDITDLFEEKIVSSFSNKEYQWDRASIENMQVSIQLLDELGQLMLNTGFANKKQLFSKEYYEQSIYKYSLGGPPEGVAYGLS